jgi:hypothetical protein
VRAAWVLAIVCACGGDGGRADTGGSTGPATTAASSGGQVTTVDDTSASGSGDTSSGSTVGSDGSASTGAPPADMGEPGFAPIRVVVISDLNDSYGSTTYSAPVHDAVAAIVSLQPDIVLSTGDMVAGQQGGLDYDGMWAGFHAAVSDQLAAVGIPFAVSPGNHDASAYAGFETEREIYVAQWSARRPEVELVDDASYPLRYSFRIGAAFFVALDSTTVGALDAEQMAWLDGQLEGSDAPIEIVYGHVPLVPFTVGRETEIIGDPALEQMLEEHGVAMFISGHHHAYYPGRRGNVRHVSMACLGSGPRALIGTDTASARAILLLEIDAEGQVTGLEAMSGAAFDTAIPRAELPESIAYGAWSITRDDLP